MPELAHQLALAFGLGLLGFIEPCTVGGHVLFLKLIEGARPAAKLRQIAIFAGTRAILIGTLGALAAPIGQSLFVFQRSGWVMLGGLYAALGVLYLVDRTDLLMRRLGPSLARVSASRASATLGLLFGLNIPACAAPLLLVLVGTVALGGGAANHPAFAGFVTLAIFGLALSAPLAALVIWPRVATRIDDLLGRAATLRRLTGLVLLGLGLWSVYLGLVGAGLPALT